MLRNFRQVFKGKQQLTGGMMLILSIGMLTYLVPSGSSASAPESVVARVYGREILYRDYLDAIRNMQRMMGRQANPEQMLPFLQSQAIRGLVQQRIMEEMASRRGILVTDDEVLVQLQEDLNRIPAFVKPDGKLKPREDIEDLLHQNGWTLAMMERAARLQLLFGKMRTQMSALVPVDPAWVEVEHRVRDEKIGFEYVTLEPDRAAVPDPGDARLEAFLKEGGARFQMPPRRVFQVASLTAASLGDAVKVGDEELKKLYESNKARFRELKASHILFKASTEAEFKDAKVKADALRARLVAGLDFGTTAEAQSEDPSAKGSKGSLGWFRSGAMVKAFEDAASALKEGEISQPVRTPFGLHLIRLDGRREKPFEEAKDQLRQEQERQRFNLRAKERLEQLRKRAGERGDLVAAGRAMNLEVKTSAPLLNDGTGTLEGVPNAGMLIGDGFRLKVGDVSKVLQAGAGEAWVVIRALEEKPVGIPPLKEIRGKVLEAWREDESRKAAFAKAKAALAGGSLASLGSVQVQVPGSISALGELGQHPAIRRALLDAKDGALAGPAWTPEGKLWVARITSRTPAPALDFETRRTLVREIQRSESEKLTNAEVADMEEKGRLRPGLSSLWGRLNGIWTDPKLAESRIGGGEEE